MTVRHDFCSVSCLLYALWGRGSRGTVAHPFQRRGRMARTMLAAVAAVGLFLPAVLAQRDKAEKKPEADTLTDQQFVMKASASDLAEINLGRVAARQASNPAVKQFAQRMVDDHTKASADLLRIANKRSLPAAR